ncbi:hypothetical protein, partial [Lactiplantibacillus fabifermentans]
IVLKVALTGVVCPFTPRTTFETWFVGSKARFKTASQAWTGPRTMALRSADCGNHNLTKN